MVKSVLSIDKRLMSMNKSLYLTIPSIWLKSNSLKPRDKVNISFLEDGGMLIKPKDKS